MNKYRLVEWVNRYTHCKHCRSLEKEDAIVGTIFEEHSDGGRFECQPNDLPIVDSQQSGY